AHRGHGSPANAAFSFKGARPHFAAQAGIETHPTLRRDAPSAVGGPPPPRDVVALPREMQSLATMTRETNHAPSLLRRKGCWVTFAALLPLLVGALWVVENWTGPRHLARV